jgi:Uma2 family endonuclease
VDVIPSTIYRANDKPAWEFIDGEFRQKMSPTWTHSRLQKTFATMLDAWGEGRGESAIELHVMTLLPDEPKRTQLVPDVCFYFHARHDALTGRDWEYPPIPPDITVEVKSEDDRPADIAWKHDRYIAWGVKMVVEVDPFTPQLDIHGGSHFQDLADVMRAWFDERFPR